MSENVKGGLLIDEIAASGEIVGRYQVDSTTGSFRQLQRHGQTTLWQRVFAIFLPAGYPMSVTPGMFKRILWYYKWYQLFDSLQAFSSSIAGLLSSRAVLQGFGVGDADASPTKALILTICQETVGRLSTIVFAWRLGAALEPEAKRYRLLADFFNDASIILDAFSPYFILSPAKHIAVLCTSGALRALCGVAAGGAKAALSVHFAKSGNIGDLNAKDSSQETVIGLLGMLVGTYVVKYISTPKSTWSALVALLLVHLFTNYLAVRSVVMNTLNRQRASLVFTTFLQRGVVLSPSEVSSKERVFGSGSLVLSPEGRRLARGRIGVSVPTFLRLHSSSLSSQGPYHICKHRTAPNTEYWVCLSTGTDPGTELKAWYHIVFLAWGETLHRNDDVPDFEDSWDTLKDGMKKSGWELAHHSLVLDTGSRTVIRKA